MSRTLDHIVYAVNDLDEAIAHFTDLLGVAPVFGGYHAARGTKNALLNLGEGCYLEIIAADEKNTSVLPPRWMGVDVLKKPQITRWCLKSEDLASDQAVLKNYDPRMGEEWNGKRQTASGELLAWEMLLPLPQPEVEVMPFMVDWGTSAFHPTERMPSICTLLHLELQSPQPARLTSYLSQLDVETKILQGEYPCIQALIDTPRGKVWI